MELQILAEKIKKTFKGCHPETISIILFLCGCFPIEFTEEEYDRVTKARSELYNRLEEVENEIIRVEKSYADCIGGGICP